MFYVLLNELKMFQTNRTVGSSKAAERELAAQLLFGSEGELAAEEISDINLTTRVTFEISHTYLETLPPTRACSARSMVIWQFPNTAGSMKQRKKNHIGSALQSSLHQFTF